MELFQGMNGVYYLVLLLAIALTAEAIAPWRRSKVDLARWGRNASMTLYGMIAISLIPPLASMGAALTAETRGIGLLNIIELPMWVQLAISIVIIDLLSYVQHRMLHKWYFLWRAHRPHHSDEHIDATTSLRFHPFEVLFRAAIEVVVVVLLGLPPAALIISFAIDAIINTTAHSNLTLPPKADRLVSRILVTPHYHKLHHSTAPEHLDTNYATIFTFWDRLFGTAIESANLRDDEQFGLAGPERMERDSFANLALDPFRTPEGGAIPKRTDASLDAKPTAADAGS